MSGSRAARASSSREEIGVEGRLGADRFADAIGADRSFVDAPRKRVVVRARLAEMLLEERQRLGLQVAAVVDAEPLHLGSVTGPIPWNFPTGRLSTKAGPILGVMTNRPSGLRSSDAILARNLL